MSVAGFGPLRRYANIKEHVPDEQGVAVGGPNERAATVVEVPQWRGAVVRVTQDARGEVGAFEVFGPFGVEVVDGRVYDLKRVDLRVG
jgi:hypothetical protein